MNEHTKTVMIFDDDDDILSICTYILEGQGWQVHTFDNCNDIVRRVSAVMPDVIMMDNWIPEFGGIKATRTLKEESTLKNIPVVYFSANSDIETLARTAGAETYLAKPFDLDELELIISKAAGF